MDARIYRPVKNAMSSGQANMKVWILEFTPNGPRQIDPLMGWTGSSDTRRQVKLRFDSRDAAIEYATRNGLAYTVEEPKTRKPNLRARGYAGNFAHNRRGAWTH